ncbi:MAG: 6-bladed beta-propeller [Gammaproteobacteria bacterium]|nr:6-bladed beta-propeller [Gammaproteobacteria bacterium]
MKRYSQSALALAVAMLLLISCAQPPATIKPVSDAPALVWPGPPETPRIQFLYSITEPRDINISQGWFQKVLDYIKGDPRKQIGSPYGIEMDTEGRLYIVDTFYKAVHVFDTKNAKHYLFPDKTIAGFQDPINIALGSNGRIYVSDSGSKQVHVFTGHGKKYQQSIGLGQFERPTGLAVNNHTGELLVLDTPASRLLVFDEQSLGIKRIVGHESKETQGFHYPTNITAAKDGRVYITDSLNYRVQALGPQLDFSKRFGAAGDAPGYFSRPKGIATDSEGNIYVVDALFDNVQIFDNEGRLLLAFGSPGSNRGEFWLPNALFIDDHDRIYVSDSHNKRVQVFQYMKQEVQQP